MVIAGAQTSMLGSYDRASGLGKKVASKMCHKVAEHELAHSISTFNTCYKDTGLHLGWQFEDVGA